MTYSEITAVELCSVGMEWPASTGPVTLTLEHLRDALTAANDDPHVRPPRVKLGHGVQLVGELNQGTADPFHAWDGAPAFGTVANLRLENDGATLVGDLVEVPAWLAEAAPSAYPTRSMECVWDVQTEGGKRYSMVITDLALGSWTPAIKDLEDLVRLVADGPTPDQLPVAASAGGEETMPNAPTAASVDVATVRQRFNFDWAMSEPVDGLETYWWWARSIRVDPSEIIADDDEGNLWSVPFTTDGADGVEFGEPTRVRETYVPVQAPAAAAAFVGAFAPAAGAGQRTVALFAATDKPTKPDPTKAAERPDHEESAMPSIDMDALRRRLGLPEDAGEEQINTALSADPEPTPEPDGEPAAGPEPVSTPEPVAASADAVSIDPATYESLKRDAEMGREAREAQLSAERDSLVDVAVRDGRIPPARRDHWRGLLSADPDGTASTLAGLKPGLIPVDERGSAPSELSASGEGTGLIDHLLRKD